MTKYHWVADVRQEDMSKFRMEQDYNIINTVIKGYESVWNSKQSNENFSNFEEPV